MQTVFTVSKLISLLKSALKYSTLIILSAAVSNVHAEYYLSTGGPPPMEVCLNCDIKKKTVVRHYKKIKRHRVVKTCYLSHYHRRHYVAPPKRNRASVSVYYVMQTIPGCPCGDIWMQYTCDTCCRKQIHSHHDVHEYVTFNLQRDVNGNVDMSDDPFNPDMRTADDVSSDPSLNDNY